MAAMALHFGKVMVPWMYVDASAAMGIAQRKGLGKIRHLHTQSLWMQDAVREKKTSSTQRPGLNTPPTCIPNILMPDMIKTHEEDMHGSKRWAVTNGARFG